MDARSALKAAADEMERAPKDNLGFPAKRRFPPFGQEFALRHKPRLPETMARRLAWLARWLAPLIAMGMLNLLQVRSEPDGGRHDCKN